MTVGVIKKCHNHRLNNNRQNREEETLNAHYHLRQVTSFLSLSMIIAKLETTPRTIPQNKDKQNKKHTKYEEQQTMNQWRSFHYAVAHVRNKNSNIQGRSPKVVKVILNTIKTDLKGKKSFPLGANYFLKEKFQFRKGTQLKRIIA